MHTESVLARLLLLTEDTREALLTALSEDAVRELTACLSEDAETVAQYDAALTVLAAAEAALRLALLDEATSPESVTAGEVRAEFGACSEQARAYRDLCRAAASPALRDTSFYFGGVRSCAD